MKEITIRLTLGRGETLLRIQPRYPALWRTAGIPEFFLEIESEESCAIMVVQRENGVWYDQVLQVAKTVTYEDYLAEGWNEWWDPDYVSPLDADELQRIGGLINDHMMEMSHFTTQYLAA